MARVCKIMTPVVHDVHPVTLYRYDMDVCQNKERGNRMSADTLEQVRRLCLDLPEVNERPSHGMPTFFIRDRKTFVHYVDNHHGDGILALWCAAAEELRAMLVDGDPEQFFVPPYVGHRGWIGVRLDRDPQWTVVADIIEDAYREIAPKALIAELDARPEEQSGA
jgi:hypothetical protein